MNCSHIILQSLPIIDAISRINEIHDEPLVLFVVDEKKGCKVPLLMVMCVVP